MFQSGSSEGMGGWLSFLPAQAYFSHPFIACFFGPASTRRLSSLHYSSSLDSSLFPVKSGARIACTRLRAPARLRGRLGVLAVLFFSTNYVPVVTVTDVLLIVHQSLFGSSMRLKCLETLFLDIAS